MKKFSIFMVIALMFSLLLIGCGFQADPGKGNEKNQADANEKGDLTGAQTAQSVGKQPWFEKKQSFYNSPPRFAKGGIWYHTKEEHAGNIDEEFDWDEVDALHIQLSDKAYYGHRIEPVGIELLDNNTARISLQLEKTDEFGTDEAEAARVFIKVKRGTFNQNTKYIIQTEDGEKLSTN